MSKMMRNYLIGLSIAIVIYAPVVSWLTIRKIIVPPELIDTMILFILASATIFYALRTSDIAEATKEQAEATRDQADASVKMAEEMREQRIMAYRPLIIQRAEQKKAVGGSIATDYFSHFEIYNTGNGPAIELETSILNEEKSLIYSDRETYLKAGESVRLLPVEFDKEQKLPNIEPSIKLIPINIVIREKRTYIVSEYLNIFSSKQNPTWYQTWLPFETRKASKEGEIYVKPGELEFYEVSEKERIDAFGSRSKPK